MVVTQLVSTLFQYMQIIECKIDDEIRELLGSEECYTIKLVDGRLITNDDPDGEDLIDLGTVLIFTTGADHDGIWYWLQTRDQI